MFKRLIISCFVLLLVVAPAWADWNPGDGHKMHFPQMPDPTGWDIDVVTDTIYDDFQCAQTGPIEDIHFWVSWKGEIPLLPQQRDANISWIDVSLHGDVPAEGATFSHPDSVMYDETNRLWFRRFLPGEWTYSPYGTGDQGWFSPEEPTVITNDHSDFDQINIKPILNPFNQVKDTIYWLGIHIGVEDLQTSIGWKTTQDHWNDDATYWYGGGWNELIDPGDGQTSLDMAFVITPEPATLALMLVGGFLALSRKFR